MTHGGRRPRCHAPATGRDQPQTGLRRHQLGVGAAHARRQVLAFVDEREVTVVALETGEVLYSHRIEPERSYWRNA
jgi:hypothetical protein